MKQLITGVALLVLTLTTYAQSTLQKRLDSLTAAYEQNGYHGVILVAKGSQILYEKGYGLANFEKKIKKKHKKLKATLILHCFMR